MMAHIKQEKGSMETMTREEYQSLPRNTGSCNSSDTTVTKTETINHYSMHTHTHTIILHQIYTHSRS